MADQNSMDALRTASAARSDHEVGAHDYHHVTLQHEIRAMPFQSSRRRPDQGRPAPR